MPKKTTRVSQVSPGPAELGRQYEGQMEVLGIPCKYVESMLLPEDKEPVRVPDDIVSASAIFKAPQIVGDLPSTGAWDSATCSTQAIAGAGISTVMAFPGTHGALWHSPSSTFTAAAGTGISFRACLVGGTSEPDINAGVPVRWMKHGLRTGARGFLPRLRSTGSTHIEVLRAGGAGFDMIVGVKTKPSYTRTATLRFQYNIGGVFTNIDTAFGIAAGVGSITLTTIPAAIESFAIGVLDTDGLPQDLEFSVHDLGGWTVSQNSATMYDIKDVEQLLDMPETTQERCTALSIKATFMGSDFVNGGNIASARLPMGANLVGAPDGDLYPYIAAFPVHADDSAVKTGSYVWWCPDSIQEYFYQPYGEMACDDLRARSSLVMVMTRSDPAQQLRLRLTLHVETLTRSALFATLVSDYCQTFPKALEIAKLLPAVTINDEHKGIFSRLWGSVKNWVKKPQNWLNLVKRGVSAIAPLL